MGNCTLFMNVRILQKLLTSSYLMKTENKTRAFDRGSQLCYIKGMEKTCVVFD